MMRSFSLRISNLLFILAPGTKGEKGNWKNECIVTPPALTAATPVGATTTSRLVLSDTTRRRNVVLPVPALPVRNTLFDVCSTNSHAWSSICEADTEDGEGDSASSADKAGEKEEDG